MARIDKEDIFLIPTINLEDIVKSVKEVIDVQVNKVDDDDDAGRKYVDV